MLERRRREEGQASDPTKTTAATITTKTSVAAKTTCPAFRGISITMISVNAQVAT